MEVGHKQRLIEHIIETLELAYVPDNNKLANVRINDCIELLNEYYLENYLLYDIGNDLFFEV